jgi:hypothetical protein
MSRFLSQSLLMLLLATLHSSSTAAEDGSVIDREWRAYLDSLAPIGQRISGLLSDPGDPQLRQEMYRMMFSEIAAANIALLHNNAKHPDWWPMLNLALSNFAVPNPDNVYYGAPIDDDGVYRISGFRGTVRLVNFQIGGKSVLSRGDGGIGPSLANYDLEDGVHIGKNGEFDVILSPTRPENYKGDWWPLLPGATYVLVRQSAYDWMNELDARFAIERLDQPAARPRATAAEIETELKQIPVWVENYMTLAMSGPRRLKSQDLLDKVIVHHYDSDAGLKTQLYNESLFDLEADEAVILEFEVPDKCRYWNQQLANELWGTLDNMHRQTSINGFTAKLDGDGKLRFVVSSRDPGVPNWLDTMGYQRGVILGRWERCDKAPTATIKKVKVADVRNYLPKDTPVISAEARDESIRQRRRAAQMRRRW